uniref:Chromosome 3 open reading frame 33 n=1 Tax=Scophthalmus maximus TaxID=52904 RepID=A0A8D3CY67_SCOMX
MPESSRGADADTAVRERQQREPGGPPSQNVVSAISQFADDNLTLVRNISTGLAIAGVLVIARSIRLKFFVIICGLPHIILINHI